MDNQPRQERKRKTFSLNNKLFSILVGLVIAGLLCTGVYVFAIGWPYVPPAPLDPGCAPSTTGCTVKAPLTDGFTAGFSGTGTFTTTGAVTGGTNSQFGDVAGGTYLTLSELDTGTGKVPLIIPTATYTGGNVLAIQNTLGIIEGTSGPSIVLMPSSLTSYGGMYAGSSGELTLVGEGTSVATVDNNGIYPSPGSNDLGQATGNRWNIYGSDIDVTDRISFGTSNGNTKIGYLAGKNVTSGSSSNTFVGASAGLSDLSSTDTAIDNTGIGAHALAVNKDGYRNTAIGSAALNVNTDGYSNTAIGAQSLFNNVTGSRNIAIGNYAGKYATGSDEFYVNNYDTGGAPADTTASLLYGTFDPDPTLQTLTVNGKLTVTDYIKFDHNTKLGYQALNSNTTGYSNTAVGIQALYYNTTGNWNTAVGEGALLFNTTGWANIATGQQTLYYNTTGGYNTATGYQALAYNTTGDNNTAVGYLALRNNTTGDNNTAVGYQALYGAVGSTAQNNIAIGSKTLYSNTTGGDNTANGFYALQGNTTGNKNTAIGYEALYSNTTGDLNTAIGNQTLFSNTTGTRNTAIGNQTLFSNTTGTNNTAIGNQTLFSNTTGGSNVAFGDYALSSNTTGTNNTAIGFEALKVNTYSDNSAFGYQSLRSNTTGYSNTAIGTTSLFSNTTGFNNTAIGRSALYSNTTGYNNTANGTSALNDNTTGHYNTAIGTAALRMNTTGNNNTANGMQALYTNTTGSYNTANGMQALYSNTTGNENTAFGLHALYANTTGVTNVAVGTYALENNNGTANTAMGHWALKNNTTGGNNTGYGDGALTSNTTGTNNTAVGAGALQNGDGGSDNTGIGAFALYGNDGSNNISIGNLSLRYNTAGSNNIALGYMAGAYETGSNTFYVNNYDTGDITGVADKTDSLLYGTFDTTNIPANQTLRINAKVGIQTAAPTNADLLVVGGIAVGADALNNVIDTSTHGAGSTTMYIGNSTIDVTAPSDIRTKENIVSTQRGITDLMKFSVKDFNYLKEYVDEGQEQKQHVGLIAQEVESIYPEAIIHRSDDLLAIDYNKIIPLLIKSIQDMQSEINGSGIIGTGQVSGVDNSSILQSFNDSLSSLGMTVINGVATLRQVITENLIAKTARIEKMEMVASNGVIYCTWIDDNGDWQKVKGDCASVTTASVTEAITPTEITPTISNDQAAQQAADQAAQQAQQAQQAAEQAQQAAQQAQQAQQAAEQAQQAAQQAQQAQQTAQEAVEQAQEQAQPQVLNINSVDTISDINVDYGTDFASANLPTTASVTLSDNSTQTLIVTWDNGMPAYDPNTAGNYVFFGTLTLPENITNTDNINATANVIVAPQKEPTVLESVSGLIQSAVAGLLNGVGNFINVMINSVVKAVSSISIIQKATAALIIQVPEALQSWSLETKSLTTGLFEPITELLR